MSLNGALVLIVEDELLLAMDLADAVEAAGGKPLGPASTVAEALELIAENEPAAAILDVNLLDGHVDPVADRLRAAGAVIVVQTGEPQGGLAHRFPTLPILQKPIDSAQVVELLLKLLN